MKYVMKLLIIYLSDIMFFVENKLKHVFMKEKDTLFFYNEENINKIFQLIKETDLEVKQYLINTIPKRYPKLLNIIENKDFFLNYYLDYFLFSEEDVTTKNSVLLNLKKMQKMNLTLILTNVRKQLL